MRGKAPTELEATCFLRSDEKLLGFGLWCLAIDVQTGCGENVHGFGVRSYLRGSQYHGYLILRLRIVRHWGGLCSGE